MADGLRPPLHSSAAPRDKEPDEPDKLLKWQQERIDRKLRGQYESAVLHLSEVLSANMKTPLNISAVRVEGATYTRRSFLGSIIDPAISSNHAASTLETVLHTTRRISNTLKKTDIFASVEPFVDIARDPLAGPNDIDIVLRTKERGRYFFSTATEMGSGEGSITAVARIRNVFGGAETFEANGSMGTKTRRAFRGAFSFPLTSNMSTTAELSAYGEERDLTTYASCFEGLRGSKAVIRHGTPAEGLHEFTYEAVIRHIASLSHCASISMREAAGTSVKSSLSHTFKYDTRDDKLAATRGVYAKTYQELAGLALGGDARFYKAEAEGQVSRMLGRSGVSISFAAKTGFMWGLGGDDGKLKTLFSDRFQLGGPNSVRSFRTNSMGPKDRDDSIGGQLYYSAGISTISDIPSKSHWPIKMHTWLNAGRLDEVDQTKPLIETIQSTFSRPSISAGVGLIYRLDPVRVELNFGVPLVASKSDGAKRGLQVGMGLEFM